MHSNTTGELPDLHSMSSAVAADQVDGRQVDLRDEVCSNCRTVIPDSETTCIEYYS